VREIRGSGIREGRVGGGGGWLGWMQAVEGVYRDEISKFIKAFLDMTGSGCMYMYIYILCVDRTSSSQCLGPARAVTSSTRRYRKSHVNAIVNSVGVY